MAEESSIEWTDATFNPWEGCQKVGPGCDNCYAENRNARFAGGEAINWGPGAPRRRTSASNWQKPIAWNAQHEVFLAEHGRRRRVFCASLADWLDNEAPAEWRLDLLRVVFLTKNLDWLLLSKRIGNLVKMLNEARRLVDFERERNFWLWLKAWENGEEAPSNVWIGATIVNQAEADRDIPKLLAVPAVKRFLSMEPLLGQVTVFDLDGPIDVPFGEKSPIDWIIVGGESGPNARPMHPDWAQSLQQQCAAARVPFLYKQWGEWKPISQMDESEHRALYKSNVKAKPHEDQSNLDDICGRTCTVPSTVVHIDGSVHDITEPMAFLQGTGAMMSFKIGKKVAGRLLDGREWTQFPVAELEPA